MKKFLQITNKSFEELGVSSHKELWTKAQQDGYSGLCLGLNSEYTKAEDTDNKFHAIFSSAREDRHGEIVEQEFDLKYFKKNPVFLDSHNYYTIDAILGKVTSIGIKDKRLQGDIEFATETERGALAAKLAAGGYLSATSIGFIPKEFDDKGNILKSELLEVSAVSVPANADALFERSVKGVEEEPPQPEPTVAEEPAEEPQEATEGDETPEEVETPEPAPKAAQKPKMSRTRVAANAVRKLNDDHRADLKRVLKAVNEIVDTNKQSKRREINKTIRKLLNE